MANRYTDEALFELAREALAAHGPGMTFVEFCAHSGVGPRSIVRRFGTWTRFRNLAGLPPRPRGNERCRKYRREDLLQQMRTLIAEHGNDVTIQLFSAQTGISQSVIYRCFATWRAFREAAGLQPRIHGNPRCRKYSAERLILRLNDVVDRLGEGVVLKEFMHETGVSANTVFYYFKSWPNFREAAGLDRHPRGRRPRFSKEEILEDIARLIGVFKRFPTEQEYNASGIVSSTTVLRRFGRPWEPHVRDEYDRWVEYRRAFPKPLWAVPPRKKKRTEQEIADDVERQMREDDAEWLRREEERLKREGAEKTEEGTEATDHESLV